MTPRAMTCRRGVTGPDRAMSGGAPLPARAVAA
jgi:hypothetical protein